MLSSDPEPQASRLRGNPELSNLAHISAGKFMAPNCHVGAVPSDTSSSRTSSAYPNLEKSAAQSCSS